MISVKYFPLIFILLYMLWLCPMAAYTQTKSLDLEDILEQVHCLEEQLMPDSIIAITEKLVTQENDFLQDDLYLYILEIGIRSAIHVINNQLAQKYLTEILKSRTFKEDEIRRGDLYLDMASVLLNMHEYNQSIHYCSLAHECFSTTQHSSGLTKVLLTMYDNAYFSQEDSTNIAYLDQAVEIAKETQDSSLLSEVYFAVGKAFYRSKKQKDAIANYQLAREYTPNELIDRYLGICIYQHLAYTNCDSISQACNLSAYILEMSRTYGLDHNLSNAYLGRAYCYAKTGFPDSTKFYLDLSEEWRSKTPKVKASPGYYNQMYKVSMIISDYDRALRYLEIKADQENQINRANKASVLGDARAEFDYLLQKARIGELKAQTIAAEEKAGRRKTTILGIGAILLISIVSFLNIRKQYKSLGYSYKSLVKKHVEVDNLNNRLMNEQKKKEMKRSMVHIKDEEKILAHLRKLLDEEKVYKMVDLSLNYLAEELGTNTSYLSTIINTHFHVNLKSLVNKYRIDEARKLLVSEKGAGYSIEGIAQEVGFQSRSVIYQTFKPITALTPTAYVKTYKSICPDS